MRLLPLLALAAVLASAAPARAADPVIALSLGRHAGLARLDPATLRRTAPLVGLTRRFVGGLAVSPDHRRVAVLTGLPGRGARAAVTIVRTGSWRREGRFTVGGVDPLEGDEVAWPAPDRIAVFSRERLGHEEVRFFDPATRRQAGATAAVGAMTAWAVSDGRLLVLRAPADGDHPDLQPQLSVFDPGGTPVATTPLPALIGPFRGIVEEPPTLAVDPATGHALVLARHLPEVTDVDAVTGRATSHPFTAPGVGELDQRWTGAADGTRLAVTLAATRRGQRSLYAFDTAAWTAGAPWTVRGGGEPVGFGDVVLTPSGLSTDTPVRGVRATTVAGTPRWTAIAGHRVAAAALAGTRVYARAQGQGLTVLSARSGRTLRTPGHAPLTLLGTVATGRWPS